MAIDTTEMRYPEKEVSKSETSHVALIGALLCIILVVGAIAAYIYYGMQNTPVAPEPAIVESETSAVIAIPPVAQTEEEKINMMSGLEKNPRGLTTAEKQAQLEALTTEE